MWWDPVCLEASYLDKNLQVMDLAHYMLAEGGACLRRFPMRPTPHFLNPRHTKRMQLTQVELNEEYVESVEEAHAHGLAAVHLPPEALLPQLHETPRLEHLSSREPATLSATLPSQQPCCELSAPTVALTHAVYRNSTA